MAYLFRKFKLARNLFPDETPDKIVRDIYRVFNILMLKRSRFIMAHNGSTEGWVMENFALAAVCGGGAAPAASTAEEEGPREPPTVVMEDP